MDEPGDLTSIVERLIAANIEFVLVGGLAAVAQGAPLTTFDVDIVHRRTPENVDRLLVLLTDLKAYYRGRPGALLPPNRDALLGPGHSLFITDLGPLDALGSIEKSQSYDDLLPRAIAHELGAYTVSVLSLEAIVELKRLSAHPKDKLALPILEETLRRSG
jgi:hypothetical protein